jgi:hemerythrin
MSDDETVTGIILARLERIESKLDLMQTSGCAKAEAHERTHDDVVELFRRMHEVERVQAEGRGKLVVIVAILTAAAGLLFEWIGRRFS